MGLKTNVLAVLFALFACVTFAWALSVGCAGSGTGLSQRDAAMRTYEGEQAACVAVYDTASEIDACRATVRRLWNQPARATGPAGAPTTIGLAGLRAPATGDGGSPPVSSPGTGVSGGEGDSGVRLGSGLFRDGGF